MSGGAEWGAGKIDGMWRKALFALCCLVTVAAVAVLFVAVSQLDAVKTGAYDPIRDDHKPADYMPIYYTRMMRIVFGCLLAAVVAGLGVLWLAPQKNSKPA